MQEKSLLERCKGYGPRDWVQVIFMILILCVGGYLIISSVFVMAVNNDPTMFMFAIAMFGVGCTIIWFALSNAEIVSTEEKVKGIMSRLDRIIEKIEKR